MNGWIHGGMLHGWIDMADSRRQEGRWRAWSSSRLAAALAQKLELRFEKSETLKPKSVKGLLLSRLSDRLRRLSIDFALEPYRALEP